MVRGIKIPTLLSKVFMNNAPLLSIVLPCFNEAHVIKQSILALKAQLPEIVEILVIDDGSTDGSGKIAEEVGATVVRHPYNIGNGASIKSGIRAAKGEIIVFIDADGQHDPADIPKLLEALKTHGMAVGARSAHSATYWHRRWANRFFNLFASALAGHKISDLTSGFRALRTADAKRFCELLPNRFSYPSTITMAFFRTGRSVAYVPIVTKHRQGTSKISLLSDGVMFLLIITKIAMLFSPLRVFVPFSMLLFGLGLVRYTQTYLSYGQFTNMSHLLITTSVVIFMLGLVAEQIAALRLQLVGKNDSGN